MVKKELIMEKALELFAENGFEATSIQQITDRCGISKGAFYLSFKSKDELILSMIDQFMHEFLKKIEQAVSPVIPSDQLLYKYFYQSFTSFKEQANFAHTFMKEYQTTMNEGVFAKVNHYDRLFNRLVYQLVKRQFPELNEQRTLELVFLIQMFLQKYSQLFLKKMSAEIDVDLLCKAIMEKVELLVKHSTITVVSPEWFGMGNEEQFSKSESELIQSIEQKISLLDEGIIKESLQLLLDHLSTHSLTPAVEAGLLLNLRNDPQTAWIAAQYENHLK